MIDPITIENGHYKNEWFEKDFFYCRDGIKEFPNHHCKITWEESKKYIKKFRNAIDAGARDCEYTRYLHKYFNHVYCFDMNRPVYAKYNVDVSKITYYNIALGDTNETVYSSGGVIRCNQNTKERPNKTLIEKKVMTIDEFDIPDVDYIKIDVEGFEYKVLKGASNTIEKYSPLIVIEQNGQSFDSETGTRIKNKEEAFIASSLLENIGYKKVGSGCQGHNWIYIRV